MRIFFCVRSIFALDDDLCVLRVDEIVGKWMKMELIVKDELYEKSCHAIFSVTLSIFHRVIG
jgi:hypothetical protein